MRQVRSKRDKIMEEYWTKVSKTVTDSMKEHISESTTSEIQSCLTDHRVELNTCWKSKKKNDDQFLNCIKGTINFPMWTPQVVKDAAFSTVDAVYAPYALLFTAYKQYYVVKMNCQCVES